MLFKAIKSMLTFFLLVTIIALAALLYHARIAPASGDIEVASHSPLAQLAQEKESADTGRLINHNTYNSAADVNFEVEQLYIKTFPTYNEEGRLITRAEFEKHEAKNHDFNPTLNAHIWQGHPDDPLRQDERFGFDDPEYNCTIRVRGNSTRGAPMKSFKVKLNEKGATLFAVDSLNFNKNYYDQTRTQNKVSMDLMQMIKSGMVSLETRFVQLFINDVQPDGSETGFVDQGIYVWIEQPNKDFLINHGLDPNGALYKPNLFEFAMNSALRTEDDPLYDFEAFEEIISAMANPDHAKLIRMLEDINNLSLDFRQVFDTYFDEENYLTLMAINVLLGLEDTLTHNLLLYSPTNSEKWYLLPWDYDGALKFSETGNWGSRFFQHFGINYFWTIPLHQRYFRVSGNADKLTAKIEELMATVFTEENINALGEGYLKVLDEFMTRPPDKLEEINYEDTRQEVLLRYQALQNNYDRYLRSLEYPSSVFMQAPVKTEEGWLFSWGEAFDFQRDPISYEIILSTGYQYLGGYAASPNGFDQTGIFFQESGLIGTQIIVPELPPGPIYYRVLSIDSEGHVQYPRNNAFVPRADDRGDTWFYRALGYYENKE